MSELKTLLGNEEGQRLPPVIQQALAVPSDLPADGGRGPQDLRNQPPLPTMKYGEG